MENYDLGKKIYEDFTKAYEKQATIDEIGIIPFSGSSETNQSPVHTEGGCVGVEKWAVELLYMFAYKNFMFSREDKLLGNKIDVLKQTRCVVLFCADCVTAWNARKEILSQQPLTSNWVETELELARLAIRVHPKSSDTFAHRRWILTVLSGSKSLEQNIGFVEKELSFCKQAADWHLCNYNAWSHRTWVFDKFILNPLCNKDKNFDILLKILKCEFENVSNWMELNVSDHCSMSYLLHVLNSITINYATDIVDHPFYFVKDFWGSTLTNCTQLILLHGGSHEALWCFRRGLFFNFYKSPKLKFDEDFLNIFSYQNELKFCEQFKKSFFVEKYLKFFERFVSTLTIA